MKLIFAVVSKDDARKVIDELSSGGVGVTKLCSTGGFLRIGNTTLLVGVEDAELDKALTIIKNNSKSRKQFVHYPSHEELVPGMKEMEPYDVFVGGATIFVLDVERYAKF